MSTAPSHHTADEEPGRTLVMAPFYQKRSDPSTATAPDQNSMRTSLKGLDTHRRSHTLPTAGVRSGAHVAGAAGSPPGIRRRKAGTDYRTVVGDHGDGNTRRFPLRTAEEGVPREARKRRTACQLTSILTEAKVRLSTPH